MQILHRTMARMGCADSKKWRAGLERILLRGRQARCRAAKQDIKLLNLIAYEKVFADFINFCVGSCLGRLFE